MRKLADAPCFGYSSKANYWFCRGKHLKEEEKRKKKKKKSKAHAEQEDAAFYEDVVEDLILSSDEDEFAGSVPFVDEDAGTKTGLSEQQRKKRKLLTGSAQKNVQVDGKSRKPKRRRAN